MKARLWSQPHSCCMVVLRIFGRVFLIPRPRRCSSVSCCPSRGRYVLSIVTSALLAVVGCNNEPPPSVVLASGGAAGGSTGSQGGNPLWGGAGGTTGGGAMAAGGAAAGNGAVAGGGGSASVGGAGGGAEGGAPTFATDFVANIGLWQTQSQPSGSVSFGVSNPSADDDAVIELLLAGNPDLGPSDLAGPAYSSQVATVQSLHFGVYRVRVQLAACSTNEEVVNGIFVYSYGGDTNANGITDNNEIDIEILCGEPNWIWLTTWTDYEPGNFLKTSRGIDLSTGEYRETEADQHDQYGIGPVKGIIPEAIRPEFPEANEFYEMGFSWEAQRVRFFIVFDPGGPEVTLWDYTDATYIPQPAAQFMLNVWHADTHWIKGGPADYPAGDAMLLADWFRYWAK